MTLTAGNNTFLVLVLLVSCFSICCCANNNTAVDVKVTIRGATAIANTDDNFICATLDWWPEDKCDYGQCPWGRAGILNLEQFSFCLPQIDINGFDPASSLILHQLERGVRHCSWCVHICYERGHQIGIWAQVIDLEAEKVQRIDQTMDLHYGITDSKPRGWSRRQASRKTSFANADYYSGEVEYATAVAAAAYAISTLEPAPHHQRGDPRTSLERTRSQSEPTMTRPYYRDEDSTRNGYGKPETDTRIPTYAPPPQPIQFGVQESEADAWERAQLDKIKHRYEKLYMTIREWEDKKRKKAERKLQKTEGELGKRRAKALQSYQNDIERIRQVAEGARAQAREKRRKEEMKVNEKANKLRTTGQLPRKCLCF